MSHGAHRQLCCLPPRQAGSGIAVVACPASILCARRCSSRSGLLFAGQRQPHPPDRQQHYRAGEGAGVRSGGGVVACRRRLARRCIMCACILPSPCGRSPGGTFLRHLLSAVLPPGPGQAQHHLYRGPGPRDRHPGPPLQGGQQLPVALQAVVRSRRPRQEAQALRRGRPVRQQGGEHQRPDPVSAVHDRALPLPRACVCTYAAYVLAQRGMRVLVLPSVRAVLRILSFGEVACPTEPLYTPVPPTGP